MNEQESYARYHRRMMMVATFVPAIVVSAGASFVTVMILR